MIDLIKLKYSKAPTQVKVKETFEDGTTQIFGGIAYQDKIIAMDNGDILDLNADHLEIIEELPWVGLSEELLGE